MKSIKAIVTITCPTNRKIVEIDLNRLEFEIEIDPFTRHDSPYINAVILYDCPSCEKTHQIDY